MTDPIRKSRLAYRPELDGLRALAIASVVLVHFQLAPVPGGFAGVDIFFALSGFLITSILLAEAPGASALGSFFAARFWRIAPAYLATIAGCLIVAPLLLLRWDMHRLAASALASVAFVPNIYFNDDLGYFSSAAIYTPLLHLWSLGVEAQFYLLWPVVLLLARRFAPSRLATLIGVLIVLSFAASAILSIVDNKTAFFSLPSRLWEFGLGALAALVPREGAGSRLRGLAARLSAPALAALVAGPFILRDDWLWPAPWALAAVVPTALLILGTEGSPRRFAHCLLSARPLTWLGRISYSLYLVHWPVLVFGSYGRFPDISTGGRWLLLALSLVLAIGLHRWVEEPLRVAWRRRAGEVSGGLAKPLATSLAGPCLLVLFAGLSYGSTVGAAPKFDPGCPARAHGGCLFGPKGAPAKTALWGDSHAGHLARGLGDLLGERGQGLLLYATGSCPPLPDVTVAARMFRMRDRCTIRNERAWPMILSNPELSTVVLAARWSGYVENQTFGGGLGTRYYLIDADHSSLDAATTRKVLVESLARAIKELRAHGKRVILSDQAPDLGFDGYRCAKLVDPARASAVCSISRALVDQHERLTDRLLAQAASGDAIRVDPRSALCDSHRCMATIDGLALYRDDHHLTLKGSDFVAQRIFPNLFSGGPASASSRSVQLHLRSGAP